MLTVYGESHWEVFESLEEFSYHLKCGIHRPESSLSGLLHWTHNL